METPILDSIRSPEDLKTLPEAKISQLADEIRAFLIDTVSQTGGHLASNLGVVELTLALHRIFDFKKDHLILDVGHQCYTHKLLTGRKKDFGTLRQVGGLSGFTKRSESEYDCFGAGHSSTSISAALGFAEADAIKGVNAYTVAVVGDGAFTGGMIHEALNNCNPNRHLIIILNENEMSISKNIGAFARHIARIRASAGYYKTKKRTGRFILRIPLAGKFLFKKIRRAKMILKNIMYGSNYFEELGLYYLGPVDGNDYDKISLLLKEAVSYGRSAVIHIKTKKGMGYGPAERQPDLFHSVSADTLFSRECGSDINYSSRFGEFLTEMAQKDRRICAVTAAMSEGTGLELFRSVHPDRFYDVGIAEEHALTFSAGLAANGMRPFFAVYSSFLQRGYDNLIHDIALQNLPVTVIVDRAGLNGADGATHHGIFDVSFLNGIPNIRIYAPSSFASLAIALQKVLEKSVPCVIRYANCTEDIAQFLRFGESGRVLSPRADYTASEKNLKNIIMITYGKILAEVSKAEAKIGPTCGVILMETLKPYAPNAKQIAELLPDGEARIIFVEEGIRSGGAAMMLEEELEKLGVLHNKTYGIMALDDPFNPLRISGNIYEAYGLAAGDIVSFAEKDPDGYSG